MFKQVKSLIDLKLNKPIKVLKNKLGNEFKPSMHHCNYFGVVCRLVWPHWPMGITQTKLLSASIVKY